MSVYPGTNAARYKQLLDQAKSKVLYVSPPYSDARAREGFLCGYASCLRDIANGALKVDE